MMKSDCNHSDLGSSGDKNTLFHIGELVRTNYGTGPYLIVDISGLCSCPSYLDAIAMRNPPASMAHFHLTCKSPGKKGDFYLNGFLPANVWNDDYLIFPLRSQPHAVLQQNLVAQ